MDLEPGGVGVGVGGRVGEASGDGEVEATEAAGSLSARVAQIPATTRRATRSTAPTATTHFGMAAMVLAR